jgi:RIO kinase 1
LGRSHSYYRGHIYIIDVSQSVEHEHPNAIVFLRSDISNVTLFFRKHGVSVMTMLELFNFITDVTITDDNIDAYLEQLQKTITSRPVLTAEQQVCADNTCTMSS